MAAASASSSGKPEADHESSFHKEQEAKAARRKVATDAAESFRSHESAAGSVFKVSGPLVVASSMRGAFMHELVRVGSLGIVGEIIKLEKDQAFVQCYEDTSGIRVGDPVERTYESLSVTLGPGLMEAIVDGIQRPLQLLAGDDKETPSPYIPLGKIVRPLDEEKLWHFVPSGRERPGAADGLLSGQMSADTEPVRIKVGSLVYGGIIIGEVRENALMERHMIMVPPNVYGRVKSIAVPDPADITITDTIMTVTQVDDTDVDIKLAHKWPVRTPRPVAAKLPGREALITGQRVIDVLFPSVLGGTCAIPGAFGCGKTCISQALSKHSNTEAIVYVGCGERGNEMAEVLSEFPELTVTRKGADGEEFTVDIMKRTCLVANTSNMPVAAREASIYTGITMAEYFRDMGKHVALMADSTSRWAEALREISGRLGEMPADGGYPAYLTSRLSRFYERAGLAKTVGAPARTGSVTVVGAVSPPGGDFSDPVTSATLGIVQVFWGLDKQLAQRKHFPSLNWTKSFSKYRRVLDPWFDEHASGAGYKYTRLRDAASHILQAEDGLLKIVQLVGEDSLEPSQKLTLEIAKLIREDFLQQDAFSENDYTCPLPKSLGILRCIVHLHDSVLERIRATEPDAAEGAGAGTATQFSWGQLMAAKPELVYKVSRLKFEVMPETPADASDATFEGMIEDIDEFFRSLA